MILEKIEQSQNLEMIKCILVSFENFNKLILKGQAMQIIPRLARATVKAVINISQSNLRNQQN
jgi:hypothetical protein